MQFVMFYLSKVLLFKISSYHDIAEILVDLALNTNQSINQSINQSTKQEEAIINFLQCCMYFLSQ
jgi:flagellar biosynthesis/type III secretory pathway ATPase